ncbi:hypothetical protein LEP1GSC062_4259 [Leptospira alexanderi serovar Manhao 3 str. L 60]|uniref:Uncharacterized protein n=1 Tax=Leptospira alexanderi serovar Manhao 3 str. L 60 TaxID=1049759 RepID=V6I7E2_9LEPT|nr:hypothetical protein LEP1GSC062_4259 [Leptospira alexanderi serovar Manhao 3 str. L 60]
MVQIFLSVSYIFTHSVFVYLLGDFFFMRPSFFCFVLFGFYSLFIFL